MAQENRPKVANNDKAFELISFTDLVLHTLLDMFEFSAHSFDGIGGPYFWNGIGIDFESPIPKEEVLTHAESVNARTIYVAHTHPLSNDESLEFIGVKADPREEIAFGYKPLPLGNKPSLGDVSFFSQLKKEFAITRVNVVGVVFSASGVWEYAIPNLSNFSVDKFTKAHDNFYPTDTGGDFMKKWSARGDFPNYFMELQKPKMHQKTYKTIVKGSRALPTTTPDKEITAAKEFFQKNGVTLAFHPYAEFDIVPQLLMQHTLNQWTGVFG